VSMEQQVYIPLLSKKCTAKAVTVLSFVGDNTLNLTRRLHSANSCLIWAFTCFTCLQGPITN
jgi:hypothetical protein